MGMHRLGYWVGRLTIALAVGGAVLSCGGGADSKFTVDGGPGDDASLPGSGSGGSGGQGYDGSLLTIPDGSGGCSPKTCADSRLQLRKEQQRLRGSPRLRLVPCGPDMRCRRLQHLRRGRHVGRRIGRGGRSKRLHAEHLSIDRLHVRQERRRLWRCPRLRDVHRARDVRRRWIQQVRLVHRGPGRRCSLHPDDVHGTWIRLRPGGR